MLSAGNLSCSYLLVCVLTVVVSQNSTNEEISNGNSSEIHLLQEEFPQREVMPVLGNLEDSIIKSILKTVDDKFETLSTRLGNIERSMANHQFNNYQHFRLVNSYIKAMEDMLEFHFKGASDDRDELEVTLNGIKTEVKLLEKIQTDLTSSIEERLNGIENRMSERFDGLQHSMQELNNMSQPEQPAMTRVNDRLPSEQISNITDRLGALANKLELFQNQNISEHLDIIQKSVAKLNQEEINAQFLKYDQKLDQYQKITLNNFMNITKQFQNSQRRAHNESIAERQLLFQTISELNDNVLQSTDFYRHTGDLIERIVGATETVSEDQDIIKTDLRTFLEFQSNFTTRYFSESSEKDSQTSEGPVQCQVSLSELNWVVNSFANNTNSHKLINDLFGIAVNNLDTTASTIKSGLVDINKITQNLVDAILNLGYRGPPSTSQVTTATDTDLEYLLNTTKGVFEIVEAVASNTGWIPYIFSRLHKLERQTDNNTKTVLSAVQDTKRSLTLKNSPDVWPLGDRIDRKMEAPIKTSQIASHGLQMPRDGIWTVNDTATVVRKVNAMYRTSNKLYRLIPALTKLLGEPEPFITLVDGVHENEGRVEVYKQGRWGTMCGAVSHNEASYLCRYLGYLGGVSLGNGYFGPGEGAFWRINVSCLFTRNCDVALPTTTSDCDHDNDVSILCDHMIRLTDGEEDSTTQRITSGYLEIHHRGRFSPVCAQYWNPEDTRVVCHQLGYQNGSLAEAPYPAPVSLPHTLFLRSTNCTGEETRLDACPGIEWDKDPCEPRAFISCN